MNGADRSLVRAIRGPITLITVGVLFALNNFTPYGFGQTWPVLLIVFGLLSLLRRGTERPEPPPGGPGFPPYGYPPPPGGYRQSSYPGYTPPPPSDPGPTPRSGDSL
ncbi:MAG TPA: DUF5668 domain-containing protein [Bryobacteraceae bacterium]|jgi:hypothetical protein|nr:DUF5668 domain-containing protein [Bryobacteraceae bacterium]